MKKLAYEKLMEDEGITLDELPQDAKTSITSVKQVAHTIKMTTQRGQKPTEATLEKLRVSDKNAVREILDYMDDIEGEDGKDGKGGEPPPLIVPEKVEQSISPEDKAKKDEGMRYESEMDALHKTGVTSFGSAELKAGAPNCFKKIFNDYEQGQPNGIRTSKYELIEDQSNPQTFNLKLK